MRDYPLSHQLREIGGTPEADILKDADSLSYFDTNLPLYLRREGEQEALNRSIWGLQRLSSRGLAIIRTWQPEDAASARILEQALWQFYRHGLG